MSSMLVAKAGDRAFPMIKVLEADFDDLRLKDVYGIPVYYTGPNEAGLYSVWPKILEGSEIEVCTLTPIKVFA